MKKLNLDQILKSFNIYCCDHECYYDKSTGDYYNYSELIEQLIVVLDMQIKDNYRSDYNKVDYLMFMLDLDKKNKARVVDTTMSKNKIEELELMSKFIKANSK